MRRPLTVPVLYPDTLSLEDLCRPLSATVMPRSAVEPTGNSTVEGIRPLQALALQRSLSGRPRSKANGGEPSHAR